MKIWPLISRSKEFVPYFKYLDSLLGCTVEKPEVNF